MLSFWLPPALRNWYFQRQALREFNRRQSREDEAIAFGFADEIDNALMALENGLAGDALRRWAEIRRKYFSPAMQSAKSFRLLTKLRRFDEAEELANVGRSRFPREAFYLEQLAEVAKERGDNTEAVRRWAAVRKAFPERPTPYIREAVGLRELGRLDEANTLLSRALRKFPHEFEGWLEDARFAEYRGDWAGAISRWEKLRRDFPQHVVCTTGLATCLEKVGRIAEADELLEATKAKFPHELSIWANLAWSAHHRADWALASARWQLLRKHFPMLPLGYVAGASALRALGRSEELDALLTEAVDRLPNEAGLALDHALLSHKRNDWDVAAARWKEFRTRFPHREEGYVHGAVALRAIGRDVEADQILGNFVNQAADHR